MQIFLIILTKVIPIFLVMAIGLLAFSLKWVDRSFVRTANNLVYRIALPALTFLSIAQADFARPLPLRSFLSFLVSMAATVAVGYVFAGATGMPRSRRGAFVQGTVRGNVAIVALAVFNQVLGPQSLSTAAIYLAFFMPIHSLVGVAVLELDQPRRRRRSPSSVPATEPEVGSGSAACGPTATAAAPVSTVRRRVLYGIGSAVVNPLMIAVYLGIVFSLLSIRLPVFVRDTLVSLQQLALPLALVGIGGSLKIYYSENHLPAAAAATFLKLLFMPFVATLTGALLGVDGPALVMLAVFSGSPAAVATYAVADSMGGDRDTAGSIIFLSHAACVVTITSAIATIRLLFP